MDLTPKQEKFCQEYIQCGNASEAYRRAYKADKMKTETIHKRSGELMQNGAVAGRISELNAEIKSKAIASAEEIQETLTKLLRGEIQEECVTVEGVGDGCSEARIIKKQVTPKDRIKAGETLAKMRGYYNININMNDKPTIVDDI